MYQVGVEWVSSRWPTSDCHDVEKKRGKRQRKGLSVGIGELVARLLALVKYVRVYLFFLCVSVCVSPSLPIHLWFDLIFT